MLVDPESYDEMTQNQELLQSLKNIAITNDHHENGQSKSAKQVYQELKKNWKLNTLMKIYNVDIPQL